MERLRTQEETAALVATIPLEERLPSIHMVARALCDERTGLTEIGLHNGVLMIACLATSILEAIRA